jgi:hypothetical protein
MTPLVFLEPTPDDQVLNPAPSKVKRDSFKKFFRDKVVKSTSPGDFIQDYQEKQARFIISGFSDKYLCIIGRNEEIWHASTSLSGFIQSWIAGGKSGRAIPEIRIL